MNKNSKAKAKIIRKAIAAEHKAGRKVVPPAGRRRLKRQNSQNLRRLIPNIPGFHN